MHLMPLQSEEEIMQMAIKKAEAREKAKADALAKAQRKNRLSVIILGT